MRTPLTGLCQSVRKLTHKKTTLPIALKLAKYLFPEIKNPRDSRGFSDELK